MLLNFFKALAHESRLRLLGFVAEREHNVQELAARMALKEPTVSHHLALLRDVGLVSMRQEGTTHWYMLESKTLSKLSKSLLAPTQLAALKGIEEQPSNDEKVLRNYLTPDGRLKDFPASHLLPYGLVAVHPDDFFVDLLTRDVDLFVTCIATARKRLKNPPVTVNQYIDQLRKLRLPRFAEALEPYLSAI